MGGIVRSLLLIGFVSLPPLSGCSREAAPANDVDIATAADAARGSVDNYAALHRTEARQARPSPRTIASAETTPVAERPSNADPYAEDSAAAAAAVVSQYYSLIGAGRYTQAWRLWDRDGKASEMDEQSFAASFAKFATYRAEVGPPGPIDAGTGQRYVTVPVRISGQLRDGNRPFAMEGPVTLHRVGHIDGATSAQMRWRINSSGVRPRPETAAQTQPVRRP